MKAIAALFTLLAMPLGSVHAQSAVGPPSINVSGTAEIKVVPDEIYVRVGVETRHAQLNDAMRQNDERVAKALAFLRSAQVPSKDIQSDFISVEPQYDNNLSRTTPDVFIVRRNLEAKLTNVGAFERVLTGLLTSGVNNVHGIEFRTSQLRKHRDAARAAAVKAAREKADALATELGVRRGRVLHVNANEGGGWLSSSYWGGRAANMMMQNASQAGEGQSDTASTLSAGQISVSATVNVTFLIE